MGFLRETTFFSVLMIYIIRVRFSPQFLFKRYLRFLECSVCFPIFEFPPSVVCDPSTVGRTRRATRISFILLRGLDLE